MIRSITKPRISKQSIFFYCVLMFYFAGLLWLASYINIWEDESYSLNTTASAHSLASVINLSYNFEGQPPAYFVLLSIWRQINQSIFFARLLSILFVVLSSVYVYRIGKLISNGSSLKWVLILFLFNPFIVWAAMEIRLYSMAIFLSTVLVYNFLLFFIENKKKYIFYFLIISLIGLYTQYFFLFQIGGLALGLWVYKGWRQFLNFCLYLLPLALLFIPNLFFISSQMNMIESKKEAYTFLQRITGVLQTPQNFYLSLQAVPFNFVVRTAIKTVFFLLLIIAYIKYYHRATVNDTVHFKRINLLILCIASIFIMYVILITGFGIIYQPRYMAVTYSMFILLLFLFDVFSFKARLLTGSILLAYYLFTIYYIYKKPIKYYDFKTTAKYITQVAKKEEPLVFFSKSLYPPFSYYYKGGNVIYPLPALHYTKNYYEENILDTMQLKQVLQQIKTNTGTFLFIIGKVEGFKYAMRMDRTSINLMLRNNYKINLDTSFMGNDTDYFLNVKRIGLLK